MASAGGGEARPAHRGKVAGELSKVFEFNPAGPNWAHGVLFLDVALMPLVVIWAIGREQYLSSAVFGALYVVLADPGGAYGQRTARNAGFGLVGAAVTALGFGIAGTGWGWLVLAAFAVTLVAGLAVTFGVHRFDAALLLNLWFITALDLGASFHRHAHVTSHVWAQVLAWAAGSALWIAVTFVVRLMRGRKDVAQPIAELPRDTSPRKLTQPLIMTALIRAAAIAGSVAIAFGLDLSHAAWLPIATLVAMKPSLEQTTLVAVQRLVGALIGALAAALLLLLPTNQHGLRLFEITRALEVVTIVLFLHAAAVRFWNYTLYTAAIAAAVLITEDLKQPSNYAAQGARVLWTLGGVGIGVLVMLLAGLLAKTGTARPRPA